MILIPSIPAGLILKTKGKLCTVTVKMTVNVAYLIITLRPSSFVYWPFGLGHRSCIGKHFALVSTE